MILYDTPYEEVARILISEMEKVTYQLRKTDKAAWKAVTNHSPKPKVHKICFTVPDSKNTYTICSKLSYDQNYGEVLNRFVFLKVNGERGKYKIFHVNKNNAEQNDKLERSDWIIQVYTGHFIQRYHERAGYNNLNGDELFVTFLENNYKRGTAIPARLVNPTIDDDNKFGIICDEGLIFSYITFTTIRNNSVQVNENRTFVDKNNLYYKQVTTLLSADWMVKKALLEQARKKGEPPEKIMKIIETGFIQHHLNYSQKCQKENSSSK